MDVCNELISETAQPIFLKIGMKLRDNKGKKNSTPRFLIKIPILADSGQMYLKMAVLAQNHSFLEFEKKLLHQIFWN